MDDEKTLEEQIEELKRDKERWYQEAVRWHEAANYWRDQLQEAVMFMKFGGMQTGQPPPEDAE